MGIAVDVYSFMSLIGPILGLLGMLMVLKKKFHQAIMFLMGGAAIGLVASFSGLLLHLSGDMKVHDLLSCLILLVSLNIQKFSLDYMKGDSAIYRYYILLGLLTLSANIMVLVPSDALFAFFWSLNSILLSILMIHKSQWKAAKYSGVYTLLTLLLGSLFLVLARCWPQAIFAKYLLVLAAMCQSAIWPFHRWLLSSLNSPTPVSALMHAGIVNGGGILLVRYHDWLVQDDGVMYFIFIMGLITALSAGYWKLIQVDIKRMLANSTMAQMGFMLMQCGLGLFPAALAHICWHGLFKAYLFLNAGTAVEGKIKPKVVSHHLKDKLGMIGATLLGLWCFVQTSHIQVNLMNTEGLLLVMVVITLWQLSKSLVNTHHRLLMLLLVSLGSALYGESVWLIEGIFSQGRSLALSLKPLFVIGIGLLVCIWFFLNGSWFRGFKNSRWGLKIYMWGINASQPFAKTMTSVRSTYQYEE